MFFANWRRLCCLTNHKDETLQFVVVMEYINNINIGSHPTYKCEIYSRSEGVSRSNSLQEVSFPSQNSLDKGDCVSSQDSADKYGCVPSQDGTDRIDFVSLQEDVIAQKFLLVKPSATTGRRDRSCVILHKDTATSGKKISEWCEGIRTF